MAAVSFQLTFSPKFKKNCRFVAHQENCLTHRALYIREINFFTLLNFFLANTEKSMYQPFTTVLVRYASTTETYSTVRWFWRFYTITEITQIIEVFNIIPPVHPQRQPLLSSTQFTKENIHRYNIRTVSNITHIQLNIISVPNFKENILYYCLVTSNTNHFGREHTSTPVSYNLPRHCPKQLVVLLLPSPPSLFLPPLTVSYRAWFSRFIVVVSWSSVTAPHPTGVKRNISTANSLCGGYQ